MVVRPRRAEEVADAIAIARAQGRSVKVVDAAADSASASTSVPTRGEADLGVRTGPSILLLDISALDEVGPFDETSRLVSVELGIAVGALIDLLAKRGFTIGAPVFSSRERLFYHHVAETPDLWRSPRALTLRDRIVAVRGVLADGSQFATRDTPRAASGPLFDRMLVGGAPSLVPAVLTHATLRLDRFQEGQPRAFRGPAPGLASRVRSIWPETIEIVGEVGRDDVVVFSRDCPSGFVETTCALPVGGGQYRRFRWSDLAGIPRPYWAYRVDLWGLDVVLEGGALPRADDEPIVLSTLDPNGVLRFGPR